MRIKNWLILSLLILLFATPIFLARYYFFHREGLTLRTVNKGELIQPTISINHLPLNLPNQQVFSRKILDNKWLMIYWNPKDCDELCYKTLYNLRQVHTALGKNRGKVIPIILTAQGQPQRVEFSYLLQANYPNVLHLEATEGDFKKTIDPVDSVKIALSLGYIYLVDPLGHIMLAYSLTDKPDSLYKDLERLIKVANIGKSN
jgi:cytochrome oxidase Cu insertion factor (SCO1/SenC/PrrC family)